MNYVSSISKNKNPQSIFMVTSESIDWNTLISILDKNDKLMEINETTETFIDKKTIYKAYKYTLIIEKDDKKVEGILIAYQKESEIFLLIDQHSYAYFYLSQIIDLNNISIKSVKRDLINVDFLYWILNKIYYEDEKISNDNEELTLTGLNLISGDINESSRGTISSDNTSSIDSFISTLAFICERSINKIGISVYYKLEQKNYLLFFSMNERGVIYTYKNFCTLDNGEKQTEYNKIVEIFLLVELIILPLLTTEYQNNCHTLFNEEDYLWDKVQKNHFLDDVTHKIVQLIEANKD